MARVRKVENLTISTQNIIPQLAETPINNVVMMLALGAPAIPTDEYTVSGKSITWDDMGAGYDLEIGDMVVADYEYDDGVDAIPPYNPVDSSVNTVLISYNLTVAEENVVPNLIHVPVAATLIVKVNSITVTDGVDWTRSGKVLTWISGTTLNVGDIVYVEYRKNV